MTFAQAKALGASVRKGEKSSRIIFYAIIEKEPKNGEEAAKIPFVKQYAVFNADQIDGLPEQFYVKYAETPRIEEADKFFASLADRIIHTGNKPCYTPGTGTIKMPPMALFVAPADYYATLAHEAAHWAYDKICPSAVRGKFGSQEYAFEELVAELCSAFVCAKLGISASKPDDHAAYIGSWLAALNSDKKLIFKASSLATKAVAYISDTRAETAQAA